MNDITPRKRPLGSSQVQVPERPSQPQFQRPFEAPPTPSVSLDIQPAPSLELPASPKKRSKLRLVLWILMSIIGVVLIAAACGYFWYMGALAPVNAQDKGEVRVKIVAGSSPSAIARVLEEKKLIRSEFAFDIYTRLSGTRSKLQAGTYSLSPSESTEALVGHLVSGKTDEFKITFLPGGMLSEHKARLLKAGYSESEVDAALGKTYTHPLFVDKPAGSDLEGYIYGETYSFSSDATVEQILTKTFDEYYAKVKDNNLIELYKNQGLSLYEGITLASIIQREVSRSDDQKQVAQVFYTRLSQDMPLGADATFVYAAKKLGVDPSVSLDSPYNTRIHAGLPPGPIASPGVTALQAVGTPASGDYLFFVSGDDGVNHFSRTQAEHDAAARQYCKKNCALF